MDYAFLIEDMGMIVKTMNLTAAARELHTTQTALSKRLAAAEKDLGVMLFERKQGAHSFAGLTPAGKEVYEAALNMNAAYHTMTFNVERIKRSQRTVVAVGSSFDNCLYGFAAELKRTCSTRWPDLEVRWSDGLEGFPFDLVRVGKLDLVLEPYSGMADTSGLDNAPVCRIPATAVICADSPLASRDFAAADDLRGLTIVSRALQADYATRKHIHEACNACGFHPLLKPFAYEKNPDLLLDRLDAESVFICPDIYCPHLVTVTADLRFVPIAEERLAFDMRLFWRGAECPAAVAHVVEVARDCADVMCAAGARGAVWDGGLATDYQ